MYGLYRGVPWSVIVALLHEKKRETDACFICSDNVFKGVLRRRIYMGAPSSFTACQTWSKNLVLFYRMIVQITPGPAFRD